MNTVLHMRNIFNLTNLLVLARHLFFNSVMPAVPSAPPLAITESPLSPNTLQIFWSPPSLDRQNGIVTNYFINISVTETTERIQHVVSGAILSLNVSSLHADYTYHYMIAAGTIQGMGPYSASRSVRMPEDSKLITVYKLLSFCFCCCFCSQFLVVPH